MANVETAEKQTVQKTQRTSGNLGRIAKYTLMKGITLLITVVIGVYLAILIANGGGYVDKMREGQIREQVSLQLAGNPENGLLISSGKTADLRTNGTNPH